MNDLARRWAEREKARLERVAMRHAIEELREAQDASRPLIKLYHELRRAGQRMDGAQGFVMVHGE